MNPTLRCPEPQLLYFASRYQYSGQETTVLALRETISKRSWMTKEELRIIAQWKAPRSAGHVEHNSVEYVKEITALSLKATSERTRIEVLTSLDGVGWPTASVVLHFFHKEPYPIMDYRALWSVSLTVPNQYSFDFWWVYVRFTRNLAQRINMDMRTLDRALWQYSKEMQ